MSDKCFVDTNILVYAHDSSAGTKHPQARSLVEALWDSGLGVLSTQVLQEFCVSVRRRAARPWALDELRERIQDYLSWEVVVNNRESALHALALEQRWQIPFWDALILHAAESSGCSILYSEDFSHGQAYGSIRVINPFAVSPSP
jgi:predicted nucleic acid-binding protein